MDHEHYTPDQIITALRAAGGIKSAAAMKLGCAPSTVRNYIDRYPEIAEALKEVKEGLLDLAEIELVKHIQAGSERSIHFYLTTQGKERGYTKRVETTGKDGEPLVPPTDLYEALANLTREQRDQLRGIALAMAEASEGTAPGA